MAHNSAFVQKRNSFNRKENGLGKKWPFREQTQPLQISDPGRDCREFSKPVKQMGSGGIKSTLGLKRFVCSETD